MKIIEAMILTQNYSKKWAGKVVAKMILFGADPLVMQKNKIPAIVVMLECRRTLLVEKKFGILHQELIPRVLIEHLCFF